MICNLGPLAVLSVVKSTYEGVSLSVKLEVVRSFSPFRVYLDHIPDYTSKFLPEFRSAESSGYLLTHSFPIRKVF